MTVFVDDLMESLVCRFWNDADLLGEVGNGAGVVLGRALILLQQLCFVLAPILLCGADHRQTACERCP